MASNAIKELHNSEFKVHLCALLIMFIINNIFPAYLLQEFYVDLLFILIVIN